MAFNLLNFLKGVAADINPFDGGKSHGNMSGAPRPASTAQPSQQQQVVASTQNRPQPQHKSLWQQALDVAAAPQNALQHLGSSFANEVKTNPANIVAHASPLVGGIVDTVNSGLNALHTNPQLEANVNQAADTAARRLTNAAANLPQSHLGETRFSGNPWINTPAQFAASVPDAFLNMPSNAGKTIAGLATYGRDLLSQGTDNPVQTNQALANVAQTANNAFNTAAPVAGAGSVAETLTKAGVEKTIPQKLLSAALESGKQGGAYGGFGGFTQGYAENPNAPVTTQLVSGVKSGVEQAATNALLASALGSGGEALNLGVRGVIDRVTAPKPVTTNLVPKPIYNNVNHVAAGVPEGGQFAKKPVDLKAQQAADLAASEARKIDPNVQAMRSKISAAPQEVAALQASELMQTQVRISKSLEGLDPNSAPFKAGLKAIDDINVKLKAIDEGPSVRIMGKPSLYEKGAVGNDVGEDILPRAKKGYKAPLKDKADAEAMRAILKPGESMTQDVNGYPLIRRADGTVSYANEVLKGKTTAKPKTVFEQNTGVVAPTRDYVKQQTKLQEVAAKGEKGSKFAKVKNELSTKGLDALSAIEKPVEIAAGGRKNTVALRNQLDRSLRADTIAGQYAKDNGLHDIVKSVDDTKAFDQYLIARHGQDLTANGVKTGRNAAQDAQLLKDLSPKYEAQAKALGEYNNKLLDKTVEYGLISKDTSKYLKEKYPNYVPFDRIFSEGELSGVGNGAGPASLSKQTIIQRIKGSDRQVSSPLESILAKTRDIHAQGERNLAAQQIAKTIDLPGNPLSLKEIKPTETIGNRSTISFIENGKKRTFETTPEVAQAAKSLNRQQLGVVEKVLSYPTRVLRLGATGVNVGFAGANVVKDAASAFINSEHPLQASIANPKVFLKSLSAAFNHSGKAYSELVREGAGGTSFDIARNAAKDTVGKIRAERSGVSKVLHTVKSPSELLRAVEDTIGRSEEFGRAVQYFGNKSAALREGKTVAEATAYGADAARNNTVNFARAGEYGRVVNSVLPYVNAGVQGSRTLMRNLRDRPSQTATKIAITGFFPVAVTTAYALSDPKRKAAYDDIQDYEKQGNIIIVPPNPKKDPKTGRWNVIKIPVSQEIANLNNIVRNGIEALHKDKSFDFAAMAGELAGTATSLNLGNPRQALGQVIPQGLKPAIEALTNKNLFTGNDIVPKSQQALDAKDQYGDYTSGTAKTLGNVTGMSPRQIDNFIRTTTGGAGQTALNASDNLLAKAGVIKPEEVRGMNLGNSVSNRFNSAAGLSEYATADKAIEDKTKQLKATAEYKALDPTEKAAALSRLTQDVFKANKLAIDAKNQKPGWGTDKNGKQIKLSERQAGLLDGKTDIRDYLTTNAQKEAMGISTSTTKASNPKDRYQKALDQYNKDKKAGKVSEVNDPTRQKELAALKVKSNFDQDTVDLYGKSYKDIIGFVNTSQNGKKLWEQVKALDKATVEAGGTSKLYDKYGNLKKTTTGSTASKKAKKGKYTFANTQVKGTDLKALSTMLKGISKPKNSKAIALKTYSPKKATISKRSA